MGKATLVLIALTALGLGSLIGLSLVSDEPDGSTLSPAEPGSVRSTGGAPMFRYLSPGDVPDAWIAANPGAPFTLGENVIREEDTWKTESLVIELAADGRVEYKIFMAQGDTIVFNWSVDGEEVYYDFHAHDAAFGQNFFTRYGEGYGVRRSGAIVAPYDGQHGWYWQNLEPEPEVITLEVAGFYDKIVRMDLKE
jgi:hypothetical protein